MMMAVHQRKVHTVEGITITHPDRVVFEQSSVTKGQLAEYYAAIAPRMLPYVANRPLSLVRCPQGSASGCFYQKHWPGTLPDGVAMVDIAESDGTSSPHVYVRDARGLVALVQHGVLEFHVWGARVDNVEAPDRIVFDLDPADDVPWSRVVKTAFVVRELLQACGLESWVKTTGGNGIHVTVPIARRSSWDDVHEFVRLLTSQLVAADPSGLVDVASKAARPGRIFIDYLRNSRGATAVAPWSTRARDCAPISIPRSWNALRAMTTRPVCCLGGVELVIKQRVNPWAAMLISRQSLTTRVVRVLQKAAGKATNR